ncbi:hypothetical protein MSG28_001536 [Choristoneura fumiferana]|uniref:Uncharacterized protein n=1 Tax=Choristoneura fumiferana TaxID=7141 RepID=A0ACC0KVC4_CHOFU|nr:hypothetical protein MSG28_001536 [Choristoneura fumiferana]
MERLDGETEMPAAEQNSEQSRLIGSNMPSRISYMNLVGNLSALIFVGIIIYCCCAKQNGSVLFAFHPILMALGECTPLGLANYFWYSYTDCILGYTFKQNNSWQGSLCDTTCKIWTSFSNIHGGLGALYSLKLKHYLAPIYTKLLHASVGLLTITLGTVTIILAFYSEWFDFGEVLRYTNLVLVLIVMLFTILRPTLKVYFRLMERIENGN